MVTGGADLFKVSIPPISSIANPKLQMKIKKQKIIFFSLIVNVLIISGLELGAGYWLQNKTIYAIPGLMEDKHPFMEFDKDLGFRIRKKVFSKTTDFTYEKAWARATFPTWGGNVWKSALFHET